MDFNCGVCKKPTRICYLKCQLCCACSMFFRRRLKSKNFSTVCQREPKCSDTNNSQLCSRCRYSRCLAVGASLKRSNQLESKHDDFNSHQTTLHLSLPPWTNLGELINAYDVFLHEQRMIHCSMHPEILDLEFGKVILIERRIQISKIEANSLLHMLKLYERCPIFAKLSAPLKIQTAAKICLQFAYANRAYLTSVYFPDEKSLSMVVTNGYYMDVWKTFCPTKLHVEGTVKTGCEENYIKIMSYYFRRRFLNFREYKKLGLQKRDTAMFTFFGHV
ncbi:hypothetical protein M3Y94_00094500 [Aphelenchoides besseyi]|nr:hypothetical protein M3Y94_00094500 [Aphelenchoides besseyi]